MLRVGLRDEGPPEGRVPAAGALEHSAALGPQELTREESAGVSLPSGSLLSGIGQPSAHRNCPMLGVRRHDMNPRWKGQLVSTACRKRSAASAPVLRLLVDE